MTAPPLTPAQQTALADFAHGDSILSIEAEQNGAVLVLLEVGPALIVEPDGTILDDSGNVPLGA